ncbi:MAG TPA: hypothetical protein VNX15_06750 [Gemmatimonadales bacterium]|nr:hypothetical protein [Gemmatimonadales bacterium]
MVSQPSVGPLFIGFVAIGIPYLGLAVLLRRALGTFGLALLGAVVAGVFCWIVLTDHSTPHGATFWMAMGMLTLVVLSPLITLEAMGRSASPPPLWARIGLGLATMVAAGLVVVVAGLLIGLAFGVGRVR